jgi:hypothetical protein
MICCFPYGAVAVTVLYVVCYVLRATQLPECSLENEKGCGTNGEDSLILMRTTNFFNASIIGCLSLHLLAYRRYYRKGDSGTGATLYGSFALACMSLAFISKGVILISLADTGIDGEKGTKENYISTAVFYVLMGMSSILFGISFHFTSKRIKMEIIFFVVLNIAATILIVLVCALLGTSLSQDLLVNAIADKYLESPPRLSFLLQLLMIGQGLWNASYSLFFLSVAFVWGSKAKQNVVFVMGLPNSLAAAGIIIAQLTTGILRLLMIIMNKADYEKTFENNTMHNLSPLFFEYATLMTAFFAHNLIFSFLSEEGSEEHREKDENDSDYPTDESYHSDTYSSQEEEGFAIGLNGDIIEILNDINYSNNKSFGSEVTNSKETSIHSVEGNSMDVALNFIGAHNDVESGNYNCKNSIEDEHISYCSLAEAVDDRTPSSNGSSEHLSGNIYGYISSFLPDTQKAVTLDNPQVRDLFDEGAVPREQSDDIVSKMAFAVTTSAVAAYSAVSSLTRSDTGSNPGGENNIHDTYGEQFIDTQNEITELKPSDIEHQIDLEESVTSQNEKSVQKFGEAITAPENITRIDNESNIRLCDEIPVEHLDELKVPLTKESLDASAIELETMEEIEVHLENETIENAEIPYSDEFKCVDKNENTRKRLPHSISRIRPRKKRTMKGKSYRKKTIPLEKKLVIQSAVKENEERNSESSDSGEIHLATPKSLNDSNTTSQEGVLIEPELGEGARHTIKVRVNCSTVPIYWKRNISGEMSLSESGNSFDKSGNNAPCQKIANAKSDHVLQLPLSNDCPSKNQNSELGSVPKENIITNTTIEPNPPEYINDSKSIDKDVVLTGRKVQTMEECNCVHDNEKDQEHISSSNDDVVGLNCFDGSLLELTAVLDNGVDPFKYFTSVLHERRGNNESRIASEENCPKHYITDVTDERMVKQEVRQYSDRQNSSNRKKDASLIPTLLQTPTFHSDCVSTLTSDFHDNDCDQPVPVSIELEDNHAYSMKSSVRTTNGDHSSKDYGKEEVFSGNDDVTGDEDRKEDVEADSNCDELREDKEELNLMNEDEVEDEGEGDNFFSEIDVTDKSENDTRNSSPPTDMIVPASSTKSEPRIGIEDDPYATGSSQPSSSFEVPVCRRSNIPNDGRLIPNDDHSLSSSSSRNEDDRRQFNTEQQSSTASHVTNLSLGDNDSICASLSIESIPSVYSI